MPATRPDAIELRAGALRLALRPDLGGSVAGLWHTGVPVLRSTEPALLANARDAASFPLVPYSNRIGFARFGWQGRDYTIRPDAGDAGPHALHGIGWQRAWQVVSANECEAVLRLAHVGDADWPFAFEATQSFVLTPEALSVELAIVNRADVVQPVGFGWHPYFPLRERSHLRAEVSERWDADQLQLPVRRVAQPGIDSAIARLNDDNVFDGWRGPAQIADETFALQLTSSENHLVVYTPQHRRYFCVEPVSHVNNAIQSADPLAHGLRALQPGESCRGWMKLDVGVV
ncbi:aldose 1-epimerase [Schlegelella sp. ID0723]|uniref:Aldose 1-epimerase n=1 Tax=Piscinibacter koreensis TaxID=2742824 RepID=A0A7Y6TUS7_9BURK|nr:aldose 1-epimerase [Schlegelella koreensis]